MKQITNISCIIALFLFSCQKDITIPVNECSYSFNDTSDTHPHNEEFLDILNKYTLEGFPGISALVYTPNEGLWLGARGKSRVEDNVAVSACNLFHSGSIAKLYTVVTALQLVENGEIELDSKINQYLSPELTDNLPNGNLVTIRQLMNHTSGIPDHDDNTKLSLFLLNNSDQLPSAHVQLEYLFNNNPNFNPGEKAEYSSANTIVLSLIIDEVTGMHHSYAVSSGIIQPLNLENTYYKNESGYPNPSGLVNTYSHYFGDNQVYNNSQEGNKLCEWKSGGCRYNFKYLRLLYISEINNLIIVCLPKVL